MALSKAPFDVAMIRYVFMLAKINLHIIFDVDVDQMPHHTSSPAHDIIRKWILN